MKKLAILFLAFVSVVTMQAQDTEAYTKEVKHYLSINGTEQQYEGALDGMFEMLRKRFANSDVPASVWAELEAEKQWQVDDLKDRLVNAYKAYFTLNEIKQMVIFYESGAGKQMLTDATKLNETQRQQIGNFYSSDVGEKIVASKNHLAKVEGEISMIWSGELYKAVLKKLSDKGYKLN